MYRFGWSEGMVGLSLAFVGVLVGGGQAGLAQKVANKFGIENAIIGGIALYTLGMVLFAFATTTWMMYLFLIPYCFGGICGPNLQSYLVSQVGANEQGELQGGLTSIQSLTTILGPMIMTGIFFYTTKDDAAFHFPGSAFLLAAVLMGTSFVMTYFVLKRQKSV